MMTFGKIIDWIKLPTRYLSAIVIFILLLFCLPTQILKELGIFQLICQYKPWLAFVLLASISVLLTTTFALLANWGKKKYKQWGMESNRKQYLHGLTSDEKNILNLYIKNKTKTYNLDMQDGVVNGLIAAGIIIQASNIGEKLENWPYNIQPWAWLYLNKNPQLLS